jgi:hypothetical protein
MDAGEAVEQGEEVSARGAVFEAGDFAGTRHQTSLAEETLLHLMIFLIQRCASKAEWPSYSGMREDRLSAY